MVGRALRRRCPLCGGGPLFSRWLLMRRTCPRCGLLLDRDEADYFLGGYVVNFVAAELLVVAGGLAAIVLTWPRVPWDAVLWGLLLSMVTAPILFYPFAKTLWLAIDLFFRPPGAGDFVGGRPPT